MDRKAKKFGKKLSPCFLGKFLRLNGISGKSTVPGRK